MKTSREKVYAEVLARIPKGTLIIEYPHAWGGQFQDKTFWCGLIDGEVWDWHTKNELIRQAKEEGLSWVVLRYHKDGRLSIMNCSSNLNNTKGNKE